MRDIIAVRMFNSNGIFLDELDLFFILRKGNLYICVALRFILGKLVFVGYIIIYF